MSDHDYLPFDPDRVSLPPGYKVHAIGSRYSDPDDDNSATAVGVMHMDHPAWPDADLPDERASHADRQFGGLVTGWLENAACRTPEQFAVVVTAAMLVNSAHEFMEFVRVDGNRVFNPHPGGHEEQWEWLQRRMERVLRDYRREFPRTEVP